MSDMEYRDLPLGSKLTHSPSIAALAADLALARLKFEKIVKDSKNPFFKSDYADLPNVINATANPLAEHGLSLLQFPGRVLADRVEVLTMLVHKSGEWIRCDSEMLITKSDAQGVGSAITYARRYAQQAILNVSGEDDDGNAATGKSKEELESHRADLDKKLDGRCNPTQVAAMYEAMKRTKKTEAQVQAFLSELGRTQFEQVTKDEFQNVLKWLNKSTPEVSGEQIALPTSKTSSRFENPAQSDLKRIFAAAHKKQVPEDDVKRYAYESYAVDSMTKLTGAQLLEVAKWVESL